MPSTELARIRGGLSCLTVIQENNFGVCRSKRRKLGSARGSDKCCKPPTARMFGVGAPFRKLSGFLRPIDWLKIDQNLVFFSLFFFYFLLWHWKTYNLVEQAIEITIQCKCEIAQYYWLLGMFGGGAPLQKMSGFLRPIDWLKIYQNLVFYYFFSSISLYFLGSVSRQNKNNIIWFLGSVFFKK